MVNPPELGNRDDGSAKTPQLRYLTTRQLALLRPTVPHSKHSVVDTGMAVNQDQIEALLARLADRNRVRSEANVQADVRQLLLTADFGLGEHDLEVNLETQVGDGRRIDVEVGATIIEVKRDIRAKSSLDKAAKQLAGYVEERTLQTGHAYVGILTDGALWVAYHIEPEGGISEATRIEMSPSRVDVRAALFWLEGVLSTRRGIIPSPSEVSRRLGADSSAHAIDRAALAALYEENKNLPTVQLKRGLWAKLLRSALGTQFADTDDLFIEHTLLVNSAEIIAHLVVGIDVIDMAPASVLGGARFDLAGIHGVVERDFFDWVLEVDGGESFIRTLSRRLSRFDWSKVEHDVLKVLYESVIGTTTRKKLGEYYTPDWLASQVVEKAVTDPLQQTVLDPSCGSGTFLFHAARRYLEAAELAGVPLAQALPQLGERVLGVDLHPVAVALARVTYLLAIGRERLLDPSRGEVRVPVYLGDSVQWRQSLDLFSDGHLVVYAGAGATLFGDELRFPDKLLENPGRFDRLVSAMAELATMQRPKGHVPSLTQLFNRLSIPTDTHQVLRSTFEVLCRLQDDGENHIWSYYVRNLARPVWLSMPINRVDVLIGNPPWLSYRHMPKDMQKAFRTMSQSRELWAGGDVATHADLSGLFVARAAQQYLKEGGDFAFVMPNAVLDRPYFAGFRSGRYPDPMEPTTVSFSGSWDLRRLRPHFFPRGSCVIFGRRTGSKPASLPISTLRWSGKLPGTDSNWASVAAKVAVEPAELVLRNLDAENSPYERRFAQGASISPRMLFYVEKEDAGQLGMAAGRVAVRSFRNNLEKEPWKHLDGLSGVVETEFVRPMLLGESVAPYRILSPRLAVLPLEGKDLLDGTSPRLDLYPNLANWWRRAEAIWEAHRSGDMTLIEQIDFRKKLTAQLPVASLRVVYSKAGMHVAAAMVETSVPVIDTTLYWAEVNSRDEGYYLCSILNQPVLTDLVRPYMSYSKDERHIDKAVWKLPIPSYDPTNENHRRLAELGRSQAEVVAALDLAVTTNFVVARRRVREALASTPEATEIAEILEPMLGE